MLPYRPPSAHSKCHGEHGLMSDGLKRLPTSRGIQIRIKYASHSDTQYRFPELREERTNSPPHSPLKDVLELRVERSISPLLSQLSERP